MPAKYPDEVLPPLQVGLPDLVTYARELHEDKATDDLIELMLAGRHYLPDDGDDAADWEGSNASSSGPAYIPHRVFVNAAQAVPSGQSGECSLKGDFDSLIGFSNRIPITVSLAVFPVTTFKLTLKKPIFIDMVVKRGGVGRNVILCLLLRSEVTLTERCQATGAQGRKRLHRSVRRPLTSSHVLPGPGQRRRFAGAHAG